ncbi:MAG: fliP [Nevskia sp.]|nr:fliP [Nevskia sp.]
MLRRRVWSSARWSLPLLLTLIWFAPSIAGAADLSFPGGSITLTGHNAQPLSGPVKIVVLLTVLSLAPALLIGVTAFTRIIIVLAMLRQAIGMQSTPPNTVLISLGLFLTIFTMTPVLQKIDEVAVQPYLDGHLSESQALQAGENPLKKFLIAQTREKDIALILELSHTEVPSSAEEIGIFQLIPSFMLSELRTGFEIGFVVFLPFIMIDIIVASVLMSLGMIMVPPLALSLPLKILMFVLIDGWSLLASSLVRSFQG